MPVVLASRAPLTHRPIDLLHLGPLTPEDASAFLLSRGVPEAIAGTLAQGTGGSPLALQLAADLVARSPGTDDLVSSVVGLGPPLQGTGSLSALLYQRIVLHIHDPEVRLLATPGLALRWITPTSSARFSSWVPAVSRVKIRSTPSASSKGSAVRSASFYRTARRRCGLAQTFVAQCCRSSNATMRSSWKKSTVLPSPSSSAESGLPARAEEIYHRLSLDEDPSAVDPRWLPGIELYLSLGAIEEIEPRARLYLSCPLSRPPADESGTAR